MTFHGLTIHADHGFSDSASSSFHFEQWINSADFRLCQYLLLGAAIRTRHQRQILRSQTDWVCYQYISDPHAPFC